MRCGVWRVEWRYEIQGMNDSSRVTGGGESGSCTQNRLVKISETLQTERRRIEARGWG